MTAETKGVGDGDVKISFNSLVGRVIEVALGIGLIQTNGWRDNTGVECHHGSHQFNAASSAEGVTHLRFGGADMGTTGFFLTHRNLDGLGLAAIVHRGTGAVCVDIKVFTRLVASLFECLLDSKALGGAVGTWSRTVVSVAAVAVTADLSINLCTTHFSVFILFKKDDASAFSDDETSSFLIEWQGCSQRIL